MATAPTRQWMRKLEVVVGRLGEGLSITDSMRVTFTVDLTIRHTPNQASILLYNLHPTEAQKPREGDDVFLSVGYQSPAWKAQKLSTIFKGSIRRVFTYRDEGVNWVTEIQAADGDRDYRDAYVNKPLSAGSTALDVVSAVLESFSITGGTKRGSVTVASGGLIRGVVLTGSARNLLHDVAAQSNAHWSIQQGQLDIVESAALLSGEAVIVTSETGMIGVPEIHDKGITVDLLLNPQVRINGAVWLDNSNMKVRSTQQFIPKGPLQKAKSLVHLAADGIYKVFKIRHEGDTRGDKWTTTVDCVRLGDPIPTTGKKGKSTMRIRLHDVGNENE